MNETDKRILYLGVKTRIIGDFVIKAPIRTHSNGFQISIFLENGEYKIEVVKASGNYEALQERYTKYSKTNDANNILPEEDTLKEYIRLFQNIESIGAYNYGIKKILYQDTMDISWYIGEPIFRNLEEILSIIKHPPVQPKRLLSQKDFSDIVLLSKIMPNAIIPYSFYRVAMRFYKKVNIVWRIYIFI